MKKKRNYLSIALAQSKEWRKSRPYPGYYDVPLMVSSFFERDRREKEKMVHVYRSKKEAEGEWVVP